MTDQSPSSRASYMASDHSMDRPRALDTSRVKRRIFWAVLAIVAIATLVLADRLWLRPVGAVDLADFIVATVERSDFAVEVRGAGVLEPVVERWIASDVSGTVDEIFAQPGEPVHKGHRILTLTNPHLGQQLGRANLELIEAKAQHRSALSTFTDRKLAAEARLLDATITYDELDLRREAESELMKKNVIPEIDYRRTLLRLNRARVNVEAEKRRFEELDIALEAERAASEARVAARDSFVRDAEHQLRALAITASFKGTLRELLVEAGTTVSIGDRVARIADTSTLMAAIRVPESYGGHLTVGQSVVVHVLNSEVAGTVSRVDPAVTEGGVTVDVSIAKPFPPGARPDLSVRASITVAQRNDALHVRRPIGIRDNSLGSVYVLDPLAERANRAPVRFGMGTLNQLEIIGGLTEGDKILIVRTDRFEDQEVILIR